MNPACLLLHQPRPYILGGHSLGGLLALETAIILEEQGHEVRRQMGFPKI